MHGNNKSVAELRRAVAAGVGTIVVDSMTKSTGWISWPAKPG